MRQMTVLEVIDLMSELVADGAVALCLESLGGELALLSWRMPGSEILRLEVELVREGARCLQ